MHCQQAPNRNQQCRLCPCVTCKPKRIMQLPATIRNHMCKQKTSGLGLLSAATSNLLHLQSDSCLSQHQDFAIDPDMDAYTWPGSPNEDKFSPGPYSNSPPPDNSGYFDFSHSSDSEDSNNTSVLSLLQDLHLDNSCSLSPLSQFTLHPASARRFSDLDSSDSGSEHSFDLEDNPLYRSRSELFGEPV